MTTARYLGDGVFEGGWNQVYGTSSNGWDIRFCEALAGPQRYAVFYRYLTVEAGDIYSLGRTYSEIDETAYANLQVRRAMARGDFNLDMLHPPVDPYAGRPGYGRF